MPQPHRPQPSIARRIAMLLVVVAIVAGVSCQKGTAPPAATPPAPRVGVSSVEPAQVPRAEVGGRLYVPVYSHVYTSDRAHPFNLAVTLSVRNTDDATPIYLTRVSYHDSDGRLVRQELTRPLKIAPLAAAEFFVAEGDTAAGSSASFLVEWQAGATALPPLVEAVMVGTSMNQGVSFTTQGRPLSGSR